MSSCEARPTVDRSPGQRGAGWRAAVVAAALALAGCASGEGFHPLYGRDGAGIGVQEKLRAVAVTTIPSRVGQRIRNELMFQNTGGGESAPRKFRLDITIRESVGSTLVQSSGVALSQIYNLDANFKLIRLSDNKVILQGTSIARAGFERFQQIYANVRAKDDAENRAATTIADDLKTRLAAVLSKEPV